MVYLSENRYKYFSQHTELVCQCLVLFAVLWASFFFTKRIRYGGTVRNDSGAVRFLTVGTFRCLKLDHVQMPMPVLGRPTRHPLS